MVAVIPGAEAWSAEGGPVGALVLHGFTGNPISVRPLAEDLADAGLAVELPRLPGHGTRWQELNRTTWHDWAREAGAGLAVLSARTERRVVVGLSLGGLLALHLAATRPESIDGVVVINPSLMLQPRRLMPLLPALKWVVPGMPDPVGHDDIAQAGVSEHAYEKVALKALASLLDLQQRLDLESVTAPLLVMTSRVDRSVQPESSAEVLRRVASVDREQVWLEHSQHVVTLDHDAAEVTKRTLAFARRVAGVPLPA